VSNIGAVAWNGSKQNPREEAGSFPVGVASKMGPDPWKEVQYFSDGGLTLFELGVASKTGLVTWHDFPVDVFAPFAAGVVSKMI
jgi:hypothetical protein